MCLDSLISFMAASEPPSVVWMSYHEDSRSCLNCLSCVYDLNNSTLCQSTEPHKNLSHPGVSRFSLILGMSTRVWLAASHQDPHPSSSSPPPRGWSSDDQPRGGGEEEEGWSSSSSPSPSPFIPPLSRLSLSRWYWAQILYLYLYRCKVLFEQVS